MRTSEEKVLSQAESKLVVDWLRGEGLDIRSGFLFWRMRPSQVVQGVAKRFRKTISVSDVVKAAGREAEGIK